MLIPKIKVLCLLLFMGLGVLPKGSDAQPFGPRQVLGDQGFGYGAVIPFDADQDGDTDLLSFPYLHYNDGTGRKERTLYFSDSLPEKEDVKVADLNGDSYPDISVLHKTGSVAIYMGHKKGFRLMEGHRKIWYRAAEYASVHLLDMNSDGIRDIVIEGVSGRPLAFAGDGSGNFKEFPAFESAFPKARTFLELDINNDGKTELGVHAPNPDNPYKPSPMNVYSFEEGQYVIKGSIDQKVHAIRHESWVDFDNDGGRDLVYTGGTGDGLFLLRQDSSGGYLPTSNIIPEVYIQNYRILDLDLDGDKDVLLYSGMTERFCWQNHNGQFTFMKKWPLPEMQSRIGSAEIDMNGDGEQDLLLKGGADDWGNTLGVGIRNKEKQIITSHTWVISGSCAKMALVDIQGDGKKDLVGAYITRIFYCEVDAKGNVSQEKQLLKAPFKVELMQGVDVDSDGLDDLVVSKYESNRDSVMWLRNLGKGQFDAARILHRDSGMVKNWEFYDYDKDGDKDLFVNYWEQEMYKDAHLAFWPEPNYGFYVYDNLGQGKFATEKKKVTVSKDAIVDLAILDLDRDGTKELVDMEACVSYRYMSDGSFTADSLNWKKELDQVFTANIDGDKLPDILVRNYSGVNWLERSGTTWIDSAISVKGDDVKEMLAGDIDGDGDTDLLCYLSNHVMVTDNFSPEMMFRIEYSIEYYENNGKGKFTLKKIVPCEVLTEILLYDIDGDGDLDIVTSAYHYPFGGISVYENLKKR